MVTDYLHMHRIYCILSRVKLSDNFDASSSVVRCHFTVEQFFPVSRLGRVPRGPRFDPLHLAHHLDRVFGEDW